jgi:hypothetical protein
MASIEASWLHLVYYSRVNLLPVVSSAGLMLDLQKWGGGGGEGELLGDLFTVKPL